MELDWICPEVLNKYEFNMMRWKTGKIILIRFSGSYVLRYARNSSQ